MKAPTSISSGQSPTGSEFPYALANTQTPNATTTRKSTHVRRRGGLTFAVHCFLFFARSLYPYANLEICNKDSLKSRVRDLKAMLKHGTLRSRVPEKLLNAAVVNADPETTIDW